jgi:hypothetical protein
LAQNSTKQNDTPKKRLAIMTMSRIALVRMILFGWDLV